MNFQLLLWDPMDTNLDFLQCVVMVGTSTTDLCFSLLPGSIPRLYTTANLAVLAKETQANDLGHSLDFFLIFLLNLFSGYRRLQQEADWEFSSR